MNMGKSTVPAVAQSKLQSSPGDVPKSFFYPSMLNNNTGKPPVVTESKFEPSPTPPTTKKVEAPPKKVSPDEYK